MANEVEKNLGTVTAFGYAKSKGYEGTEEEFAQLMADYAEVGQQAAEAAYQAKLSEQSAAASKEASQTAATNAANAKQAAETAQQTAESKATEASSSAIDAADARDDAQLAKQRAEEAKDSAEEYEASAKQASDQAQAYAAAYYALLPTDTASGPVASFSDGADGIPVKSLVVQINPQQAGSGDPSPDNVRPITGWTGATITRTGENLFDSNGIEQGGISSNGSIPSVAQQNRIRSSSLTLPAGTYTITNSSEFPVVLHVYDLTGDNIQSENVATWQRSPFSFTLQGSRIIRFTWRNNDNTNLSPSDVGEVMLCTGSVARPASSYTGTTLPVSWETEAGTVYGGTLDVTTGLLTVDAAKNIFTWGNGIGSSNLGSVTRKLFALSAPSIDRVQGKNSCSMAPFLYNYLTDSVHFYCNGTHALVFLPTDTPTSTEFELVANLAAPVTYQLTPQQVNTMLGYNALWSDTGDTSVTYRADTKRYIDKRLSSVGG